MGSGTQQHPDRRPPYPSTRVARNTHASYSNSYRFRHVATHPPMPPAHLAPPTNYTNHGHTRIARALDKPTPTLPYMHKLNHSRVRGSFRGPPRPRGLSARSGPRRVPMTARRVPYPRGQPPGLPSLGQQADTCSGTRTPAPPEPHARRPATKPTDAAARRNPKARSPHAYPTNATLK